MLYSLEPRQILLMMIVKHIDDEISNQTKDLDICAKIVADIVHQTVGSAREDITLLFRERDLLRTIIQTVIKIDRDDPLSVSCVRFNGSGW